MNCVVLCIRKRAQKKTEKSKQKTHAKCSKLLIEANEAALRRSDLPELVDDILDGSFSLRDLLFAFFDLQRNEANRPETRWLISNHTEEKNEESRMENQNRSGGKSGAF